MTDSGRAQQDELTRMIQVHLTGYKRFNLKSMPQLADHWTIAAFKDNDVRMAELIVLLWLVAANVGAIGCGKLLLRSMSSACKLDVTEGKMPLMQGVVIVRDAQQCVFVGIARSNSTGNTFSTMCVRLETSFTNPAAENRFAAGYPFKRPAAVIRGDGGASLTTL